MSSAITRNSLVQRARFMPKTFAGGASVAGYILTIAGVVLLIAADFVWVGPALMIVAGIALMCCAGMVIQKKFLADAKAAGFDDAQIRAIEDEAERLTTKKPKC